MLYNTQRRSQKEKEDHHNTTKKKGKKKEKKNGLPRPASTLTSSGESTARLGFPLGTSLRVPQLGKAPPGLMSLIQGWGPCLRVPHLGAALDGRRQPNLRRPSQVGPRLNRIRHPQVGMSLVIGMERFWSIRLWELAAGSRSSAAAFQHSDTQYLIACECRGK